MALLNEKGRLFGAVNVVDAAVVLVALAVVAGGLFLVFSGGDRQPKPAPEPEPSETTNLTLTFEDQRAWQVESIDTGRTVVTNDDSYDATINEQYVASGSGRNVDGALHVTIEGTDLSYRPGETVTLDGQSFTVQTSVVRVGDAGLDTETTRLSMTTDVPSAVADSVEPGTELTAAGTQFGTVTDVETLGTHGPNTTLHVGLELETIRIGSQRYTGTTPLSVGRQVRLSSAELSLRGHVTGVGSTVLPADNRA